MSDDKPTVDIVFDGPPSGNAPRFVEVERGGRSIRFGKWIEREDGYWVLRIPDGESLQSELTELRTNTASQAETIERLEAELETEHMRLAGCGVAAMANTPDSAAQRIDEGSLYWSASYGDVCRAVDREMQLREVAHAAWHALDDSGEEPDGSITILRQDYDALSAALDLFGDDIHAALQPENANGQPEPETTKDTTYCRPCPKCSWVALPDNGEPCGNCGYSEDNEAAMLDVIDERDHWENKATELAEAVGRYFGLEVGEHSNLNCPVQTAIVYLQALSNQPEPEKEGDSDG